MVIAIREGSEIPIYQQIRDQIVQGISDGRLKANEQLPTVRSLAEEVGINSMTVNKAYQLLKQQGYIIADRRNGARVCRSFAKAAFGTCRGGKDWRHDAGGIFKRVQTVLYGKFH